MNELVRYDAACRAVAEAKAVDEVKDIRDQAMAMRLYAKQAKNRQLEADAFEIRLRAEARVGEMMEAQPKAKPPGINQYVDRVSEKPEAPITLAEAGIDKNLANRARKLNALTKDELERVISDGRAAIERVEHQVLKAARTRRLKTTFETPSALLPSPTGRKICVARNPAKRQWMLAIGPNISRAELLQRETAARAEDPVAGLQQERDELLADAAALEAEAARLRKRADAVRTQLENAVKDKIGPVLPFTETYDFQCEDALDAELAALPQEQLVARLLAARNTATGPLIEIGRGYWGDVTLTNSHPMQPGPGAWTRVGSPEWLDEMFPGWNVSAPHDGGAP